MKYLFLAGVASLMTASCDDIKAQLDQSKSETASKGAHAMADKNRLEADVRFLADDLLEGREAGTRGYDLAAKFVAERYRALGLEPGGGGGTYFQQVPMREYKSANLDGGTITFTGDGAPQGLEQVTDYFVGSSARFTDNSVEAPLVFVGFGFASEEHGRDDFEGLDVEGKIVVYLFGAPKFLNSEELAHFRSTSAQRASERGAIGAIVLYTPTLAALYPYEALVKNGQGSTSMSWLKEDGEPFSTAPNFRGGGILNLEASAKLFANAPATFDEIIAASETEEGVMPTFELGFSAKIEQQSVHTQSASANVVGILPGTDPALRDEYVVLTAHLDHEGIKPTPEEGDDELYNGAMDNATGTASMLEVMRLLKKNPPKRSVMVVALTAEEKGLVGSDYNARNPTVPAEQVVANVNLDMPILTYPFTDVIAFGAERSTMYPVVEKAVEAAGLTFSPDPQPEQGLFTRSDQYSYVKQGVPATYIKPGFGGDGEEQQGLFRKDHYHKPSDEADLIDYEQMRRFAQVNYEIANGVANMETRPLWKKDDFFARTFNGPMEE